MSALNQNIPIAHRTETGREQTLTDHLNNVGNIAENFAKQFGAGKTAKLMGSAHDLGKFSQEVQNRLHNPDKYGKVDHSTAGAIELTNLAENFRNFKVLIYFLAMAIAGHHSGLMDGGNLKSATANDGTFFGRLNEKNLIPNYNKWKDYYNLSPDFDEIQNEIKNFCIKSSFSISFFIRMIYSCLVDADFLDTEAFMSESQIERGGYDSLDRLSEKFDAKVQGWFSEENPSEINKRRTEILKNCISKGSEVEQGLYTLTVPTGGGKTTASMGFALNHAVKNKMSRIIYVIPYTSIIDQNAKVFSDIFGAENVVEHHSGVIYDLNDEATSAEKCKASLATENWDAPIIITTAVQFFESLFANKSSKCRKLHNIANSVVIFDEAQTLPTKYLTPCVAAISELVNNYNTTAVLCTATQPALDDMFSKYLDNRQIKEISEKVNSDYSFFERVTIVKDSEKDINTLAEEIINQPQILTIVNTKANAQNLYEIVREQCRENVYCLTVFLPPIIRKQKIQEIKNNLKENKPCRVIATSLIEAGVDLDFPCVYREDAGLDSLLQAAGRCNREGKMDKRDCLVHSFTLEDSSKQFAKLRGALRETWRKNENINTPSAIESYFRYYREVLLGKENLDRENIYSDLNDLRSPNVFPFKTVSEKFNIIESDTETVYITLDKDSEELINKIKDGHASKNDYRKLNQYGVSIYKKPYDKMIYDGDIVQIAENIYILANPELYNDEIGLMPTSEEKTGCAFMR